MKKGFKRLLSLFGLCFLAITSGISLNARGTSVQAFEEAPETPVTYEENTLVLHLFRNDGAYNRAVDMHIWQLEPKSLDGVQYKFTHEDDYGVYLELSTVGTVIEGATKIGLINRNDGDWGYGQTADMHYSLKDAVFDEHKAKHLYFVDLESTIYESVAEALSDKVLSSVFSGEKEVSLKTNYDITGVVIKENGVVIESTMGTPVKNETEFAYYTKVTLSSSFVADFKKTYTAEVSFKLTGGVVTTGISSSGLFDTTLFEETLTYDGNDLGLTYSAASSTFKVWAPTSDSISLRIYNTGTPLAVDATLGSDGYVDHEMVLGEKGVWSVSVNGDLHGKYYTYFVKNYAFPDGAETADPYGRAAGVNGDRTMILDLATTNPEGWDEVELKEIKNTELVVYELHVADLTMDESWTGSEANRGKYLGLIEEGTTYEEGKKKVTTGFDHIKELGVNAVQILPFFDQDNDEVNMSFNWGYNPKNYNVLEGGYASDPYDGAVRINEFKQVVQAYAKEDIRIIMDVVYNHVSSVTNNAFHKLVPEYYFRYQTDGSLSNNSGVGNDTASERIMFSRFMVDSTEFLAKEYKLGGYRFDLMGLHDIPTMNALADNIHEFDEDFVIFGEPWDMYKADGKVNPLSASNDMAMHANLNKMPTIGGFNDNFRDGVKGSVFESRGKGWLQSSTGSAQDASKVVNGLLGKYDNAITNPTQVINYVDCHDNNTIFDKLSITAADPEDGVDEERLLRQVTQSAALTLTAEGTSFLHAGAEILRSKPWDGSGEEDKNTDGFDSNSYKSSYAVNSIKWGNKITYLNEYNIYRTLVHLKLTNEWLQLDTRAAIEENVSINNVGIDYMMPNRVIKAVYGEETDNELVIYHVGPISRIKLDLTGYEVVLDTSGQLKAGSKGKVGIKVAANTSIIVKKIGGNGGLTKALPKLIKANNGNNGLVIGLSVGIPVVIIGITVVIYFGLKRKSPAAVN